MKNFYSAVHSLSCNFLKAKNAFSLVEMLMTLLVASLLLAALAPVITKRLDENVAVLGNYNEGPNYSIFQYDDCKEKSDGTSECKYTVPADVHMMDVFIQGAGGGGAGATAGVNENCSFNLKDGNTSANKNICKMTAIEKQIRNNSQFANDVTFWRMNLEIVPGMQNFASTAIGAGGGGGGSVGNMDCNNSNHFYLTAAQNGGSAGCVTKYNVGDSMGPAIVSGTSIRNATDVSVCTSSNCCYTGNTALASSSTTNTHVTGYDARNRTVCTYLAGVNACAAYAPAGQWRLPNLSEMEAWKNNKNTIINNGGKNSLLFCTNDGYNVANIAQCTANTGCGSIACRPHHIRGGFKRANLANAYAHYYYDTNGTFDWNGDSNELTGSSTRCVSTSQSVYGWQAYNGGGGSSGAVAEIYANSAAFNKFLKDNAGHRIHIFMHGPFAGANASAANTTKAADGDNMLNGGLASGYHFHTMSNGAATYVGLILEVYSGFGGKGASIRVQGAAAAANSNACNVSNNVVKLSSADYKCTAGNPGTVGTAAAGGTGGSITYGGVTYQGGAGASAGANNVDGANNGAYGAGGGGAASSRTKFGKGGTGGASHIYGTYKVVRQGAPGGGGGGGAMLIKKNIAVTPGQVLTIKVGKGGAGGIGGAVDEVVVNGANGGDTQLIISDTEKYIAKGGLGGKKGDDSNLTPVGGIGGEGANGSGTLAEITKGSAGEAGKYQLIEGSYVSTGGMGGKSGSGYDGTCGGLTRGIGNDKCANPSSVNAVPPIYQSSTIIMQLYQSDKAQTGFGGGGGAIKGIGDTTSFGSGANGTSGYVYIKWKK